MRYMGTSYRGLRSVKVCVALLLAVVWLGSCTRVNYCGLTNGDLLTQVQLTPQQQLRFNEYYLSSVVQRERGRYDAAYELLQRALCVNPDAPEALFDMAMLRFAMGGMLDTISHTLADSLLRRAIALAPSNRFYKESYGRVLLAKQNLRGAAKIYEELAQNNTASEETLYQLAQLYEHLQDYRAAISTLERLENKVGNEEELTFRKFRNYIALHDSANAFRMVEELSAANPHDLKNKVMLGETYMEHGRTAQGLAIIDSVLSAEPNNYFAQLVYLEHFQRQGSDSLAQSQLRRVILNPVLPSELRVNMLRQYAAQALTPGGDTLRVLNLMRAALELPQEDAALGELCAYYMVSQLNMPADSLQPVMEKILEAAPDNKRARLVKLQALVTRQDVAQVAAFCRESQLYCPDELPFYYYEASAHLQLGDNKQAIEALQRGVKQIKDSDDTQLVAEYYGMLGDLLHEEGRDEEAFEAYEEALRTKSDLAGVLNNYAYFLALKKQDVEKAEDMSRQAVEKESQNATFLDTYAWCLYQGGKYEQARIYIDEALKYSATDVDDTLLDHAGDIYYYCGLYRESMNYWKQALQKAETEQRKRELRRKIQRGKP